jgi:hypothetical protein
MPKGDIVGMFTGRVCFSLMDNKNNDDGKQESNDDSTRRSPLL